jgi:hypothetical protein
MCESYWHWQFGNWRMRKRKNGMHVTIAPKIEAKKQQGEDQGKLTSNDCAYQSCTFLTDGMSLRPSGRFSSSWTRCANRIGSSSARN